MMDSYYTFHLNIEGNGRTVIDATVGAKPDPASIAKAKHTIQKMLDDFTPAIPVKLQEAAPTQVARQSGPSMDLDKAPTEQQSQTAGNHLNQTYRPAGARGLLRLRCPVCKNTFGTFLREYQTEVVCKCGHPIDLTAPLALYHFTCPYCEKDGFGKTNLEDPDITIRCKCGEDVDLYWNPKAKEYQN